jgi:hypothetical protein
MTDHQFKNGIKITIPDDLSNPLGEWTNVKMAMSILMTEPPKVEVNERKPYDMARRNTQIARRTRLWHKGNKQK